MVPENMDSKTKNLSRNDFQNSTSDAIKLLKQDTNFLDVIQYKDNQSRKNPASGDTLRLICLKLFGVKFLLRTRTFHLAS